MSVLLALATSASFSRKSRFAFGRHLHKFVESFLCRSCSTQRFKELVPVETIPWLIRTAVLFPESLPIIMALRLKRTGFRDSRTILSRGFSGD